MASNRASWALLMVAAIGSPFPFGSTGDFMIALWCLVLGIGLVLCSPEALRTKHSGLLSLAAVATIAFLWVLYQQLAPQPWMANQHPLWTDVARILGEPVSGTVSIGRNQPWFSIGGPLLAILALSLSFVVGTDRTLAWRVIWLLAWAGAAYALYAIAAFFLNPTTVLWREKPAYLDSLTGTFINRNTAATFFGSCSVLWLIIVLDKIKKLLRGRSSSLVDVARHILNNINGELALSIGVLLLCLTAMFLTRSRAGVLLSLVAFMIAGMFSLRGLLHTTIARVTAVLVVGMLLWVLLQSMGSGVGSRFGLEGVVERTRGATWQSTTAMIADRPWLGTGLGTFEMAFPSYRRGEVSMAGTWDRAHNTLLEIASELGIPFAIIVFVVWLLVIAQLIVGSLRRRRDEALPVAGLSVGVLGLSHSLVDFSLQIPGYAIPFCAVVGIGLAQSFPKRGLTDQATVPGSL